MQGLKTLLQFKIAATLLLWCMPLLFFPPALFAQAGMPPPQPMLFARLLGAAYLSLLCGYGHGIREIDAARVPTAAVLAGIVSNGLAFVILLAYGIDGAWSAWSVAAQWFMWLSTAGAGVICGGLLYFNRRFCCTVV